MKKVHLIGVCGTAMGTLAALLKHKGLDVQGSDQDVYPPMSDFLAAEAVRTLTGYRPEHITSDLDLVIVGNAISRGNPELEEVLDRKLRYCSLPEAIRDNFLWDARSIVIAGTHGKTTTTSLTGWVLSHAGLDPSVLVGGIARNFGDQGSSYRIGSGRDFVIEGDEYDSAFFDKTAKFLKYLPDIAVVNNVEFDHADIYADMNALTLAFQRFVRLVPRKGLLLIGADSPAALALAPLSLSRVETFGTNAGVTWQAVEIEPRAASTAFRLVREGSSFGTFEVPLVGVHNVRNTLAAIAVAAARGVAPVAIADALRLFGGVKRRLEVVGTAHGVTVYDDFAHHPTAVAETLAAVRSANPERRIWAVFEPRSASSCRRVFQDDYARAFDGTDEVMIAPVFLFSLPESERLSVPRLIEDLRARSRSAREATSLDDIIATIVNEHHAGDLVVMMSNGGFGGIHKRLLKALDDLPHVLIGVCMAADHRIELAGDSTLIVEFEERIDAAINARAVQLARAVEAARLDGIRDIVPTYRSVAVYFDPLRTDFNALTTLVEARVGSAAEALSSEGPPIRIPVCYGGEFGPDLPHVAVTAGMSERDVIDLHASTTYRVFMLGFLPGFAYLGTVDERIAVPRRETPRVRIASGSVGIAGRQTAIYPMESPGGWQLIGRTPAKPFELSRPEPFLLKAGDEVQFYPIQASDFDKQTGGGRRKRR